MYTLQSSSVVRCMRYIHVRMYVHSHTSTAHIQVHNTWSCLSPIHTGCIGTVPRTGMYVCVASVDILDPVIHGKSPRLMIEWLCCLLIVWGVDGNRETAASIPPFIEGVMGYGVLHNHFFFASKEFALSLSLHLKRVNNDELC